MDSDTTILNSDKGDNVLNGCALSDDGLTVLYRTNVNLTTLAIPDGVQVIDQKVFRCCKNITTIIIPNSVKTIGKLSFRFSDLENLKKIIYRGTKEEWESLEADLTKRRSGSLRVLLELDGTKEDLKDDLSNIEIIFENPCDLEGWNFNTPESKVI